MSAYSDRIIADGASNHWRLGETSGTTAVDVIGAKNGTISGGVTLAQPGAIADGNTAMLFDATGDYVSVPPSIPIGTGPFTLECWLNSALAFPGTPPFIIENGGGANGAGFAIVRSSPNTVDFKIANGTTNTSATGTCPFDGRWHHVVGTLARGTPDVIRIYVDGVLVNSGSPPANGWNLTSPLALLFGTYSGGQASPDFRYFGSLDDVAIYPRALTAPEIAAHYTLGKIGKTEATTYAERVIVDGASNHWRLGELSGTTAVDVIGAKNGTISGGVTLAQPGAIADGNTAMVFDGTTGKIVTTALSLPAAWTCEAWLKTAVGQTYPNGMYFAATTLTAPNDDFLFYLDNGRAGLDLRGVNGNSGHNDQRLTPLPMGAWHHVVWVFTGTAVQLYTDGVLATLNIPTTNQLVGSAAQPHEIGAASVFPGYFNGSLDDIAIYPRALTAPEIAAHYTLGTTAAGGSRQQLSFGYWKKVWRAA